MNVLVVIVNYRTADLVVDCLRAVAEEVKSLPSLRVVVMDNASGDDSVPRIQSAMQTNGWTDWATFMPLEKNGGFAYGNNAAIRPALALPAGERPDYVLLLNPDTVIRPGAIRELIDFMNAHPEAGLAGSRLEDPDGTPQRSAFRFHTLTSEIIDGFRVGPITRLLSKHIIAPEVSNVACPTNWVAGASLIVRAAVFDKIGLLDEGYFMYFEEVDFCLRAARAGFACWYVPTSRVVHLVGQASGVTNSNAHQRRRPAYWFEARRRYFVKNYGPVYALLTDAVFAMGFAMWRLRVRLTRSSNDPDPPRLLGDFVRHSVFFRGFAT